MNLTPVAVFSIALLLAGCTREIPPPAAASQGPSTTEQAAPTAPAVDANERGPHGGRLLRSGDFAVELRIFESGIPPEFHAYGYARDEPLRPEQFQLEVTLTRLDGVIERFEFTSAGDFLRGEGVVAEPHSFDVMVKARHAGADLEWTFPSYEGRVQIPPERVGQMALATEKPQSAKVREQLALGGIVRNAANWHAEIDAYGVDQSRLRVGQPVALEAVVGDLRADGTIRALAPRVTAGKPAMRARVELNGAGSGWLPEQFVRAHVTTAVHLVPLAVRTSALQRFRDSDVVFARVGDLYEVRILETGASDPEWTEVRAGLGANETYVTENSFLIRAEIQKIDGGHSH